MNKSSNGIYVSGQGIPVILLHSSLSSARQWQPLVKLLEPNFLVINVDILGYGNADKVSDELNYNFDVEIKRVENVLNTIAPNQSFHLVGHSCGGAIALKLAVEQSESLLSLSLYEPVAFHLLEQNSEARAISEDFARKVDVDDTYKAAEIFTDFWNNEGFFRSLPRKMQDSMAKDMPKVKLDSKGLISESYSLADLSVISCRTLLMTGNNSPKLIHILSNEIKSSLTNVEQKCFPTGHMGPVSHSDLIHPSIADFIQKI